MDGRFSMSVLMPVQNPQRSKTPVARFTFELLQLHSLVTLDVFRQRLLPFEPLLALVALERPMSGGFVILDVPNVQIPLAIFFRTLRTAVEAIFIFWILHRLLRCPFVSLYVLLQTAAVCTAQITRFALERSLPPMFVSDAVFSGAILAYERFVTFGALVNAVLSNHQVNLECLILMFLMFLEMLLKGSVKSELLLTKLALEAVIGLFFGRLRFFLWNLGHIHIFFGICRLFRCHAFGSVVLVDFFSRLNPP